VTGRLGRRCKQLLEEHTEHRGYCNCKRKHYITLYGELALEEAMDPS